MALIEELTKDALLLSPTGRAQLARTLLVSLEEEETGAEAAWEEEVSRRLSQVKEGAATGRPAEDVFRDLRERHQA